jgi:glyoxylase-like metal-dependent hydrolase (beta-lactamase superfamily II)
MVTKIKYGNTNTFLIKGTKANILIDTDYAGTLYAFYKAIKDNGIKISDIDYLLATHYHPDHIGIAGDLMEQGVKLIIMESQLPYVHYSDPVFAKEPYLNYKSIDESKGEILSFADASSFLFSIGIKGDIMPAPSHSEDSIIITLDDGTVIAGDLEPYEYLEAYEENDNLKADWGKLLSLNPKRILYAHANEKIIN